MLAKRKKIAILVAIALGVVIYLVWPSDYCLSARFKYGITARYCPDGELRQKLYIDGWNLRRGGTGTVLITAVALYSTTVSDQWYQAEVAESEATLELIGPDGKSTPIRPAEQTEWQHDGGQTRAEIALPGDLGDGDYVLRAHVNSSIGAGQVDLPLALYAPARIHVITDRPLYEPGNQVDVRAVVLRARDLAPIDRRPGAWIVRDPSGQVLLEEKATAGEWGVVAGSFPLDREAATGTWSVTWQSGRDRGQAKFTVEPFKLPRFRVELTADRSYYGPGQKPVLRGMVVYSAGAPVSGAKIAMKWWVVGRWPPPTAWLDGALPTWAQAGPNGRFVVELPDIPSDLQGQARLMAGLGAIDPAGDRVTGSASVLLSEDAIQVQAITELDGGLVQDANNRVYLRVTTADGRPLSGAAITVKPAWSVEQEGIRAELDRDGVTRIQLDPGPPVNVVIPPLPVRRASRSSPGQLVARVAADELVSNQGAPLVDQAEMDTWLEPLERCAKWVEKSAQKAHVVLRVGPGGTVADALARGRSVLDACVLSIVRRRRLPAGQDRLYSLRFQYQQPLMARLDTEVVSPFDLPTGLEAVIKEAALDARDCLPGDDQSGVRAAGDSIDRPLARVLSWRVRAKSQRIEVSWIRASAGPTGGLPGADSSAETISASVAHCLVSRVIRRALPEPAGRDSVGLVRYWLRRPDPGDQPVAPQPTVMKGYELLVAAEIDGKKAGETRLRMKPGTVPELRLRADPVLAEPGREVTVALIRGPGFTGNLPKKVTVEHFGDRETIDVGEESRTATFKIPQDGRGWYQIAAGGARALVYVRPGNDLAVSVTPERARYAPGAQAVLRIATKIGGSGAKAAVGLIGVDESLAQLVPLPGPDELGQLRPAIPMTELAFGAIDSRALVLGRIRGQYAAEATILRVSSIPALPDIDVVIDASAETPFDPIAELTDRFYIVLNQLHSEARNWETSAVAGEQMKPETMAQLWERALDACARRGDRIDDSFGRRLRLHRLPADLLALTDPRQVIAVATHLPEDVENWSRWVARKRP